VRQQAGGLPDERCRPPLLMHATFDHFQQPALQPRHTLTTNTPRDSAGFVFLPIFLPTIQRLSSSPV
jgi:hypothetical protein